MDIERLLQRVKDNINSNAQDIDAQELTDELLMDIIERCIVQRLLELGKVRPEYTDRTIEF